MGIRASFIHYAMLLVELADDLIHRHGSLRRDVRQPNQPQSEAELVAIRESLKRGRPFDGEAWQKKGSRQLGLEHTFRPPPDLGGIRRSPGRRSGTKQGPRLEGRRWLRPLGKVARPAPLAPLKCRS